MSGKLPKSKDWVVCPELGPGEGSMEQVTYRPDRTLEDSGKAKA